jgi:hypothetical protein
LGVWANADPPTRRPADPPTRRPADPPTHIPSALSSDSLTIS